MKYAAIIFDLDGTALPSGRETVPSRKMIETAQKYNQQNLCAATGRSWNYAEKIIKALGLAKPCIISGGASIIDPKTKKILWQKSIDTKTAQAILEVSRHYDFPIAYTIGLETVDRVDPKIVEINQAINTFYLLNVPFETQSEIFSKLAGLTSIQIARAGSWEITNGDDLHITHKEATKEHAVKELCSILGVESADVAGVGDGQNDVHLFNAVGYKVAMGNAVLELKEAADLIIGSIDNDGLADFIESAQN